MYYQAKVALAACMLSLTAGCATMSSGMSYSADVDPQTAKLFYGLVGGVKKALPTPNGCPDGVETDSRASARYQSGSNGLDGRGVGQPGRVLSQRELDNRPIFRGDRVVLQGETNKRCAQ